MRRFHPLTIFTLVFCGVLIGVLVFLHFRLPGRETPPPASSASASASYEPLVPWTSGGDIVTRIG